MVFSEAPTKPASPEGKAAMVLDDLKRRFDGPIGGASAANDLAGVLEKYIELRKLRKEEESSVSEEVPDPSGKFTRKYRLEELEEEIAKSSFDLEQIILEFGGYCDKDLRIIIKKLSGI